MTRYTIKDIAKKYQAKEKLVVLAAYSKIMAELADDHAEIILVGDSLGMVTYGMESTLPVSLDLMIQHGLAVVNNSQKSLIVVDMPFATYQVTPELAFQNAARLIQNTGANAVKLEGGTDLKETISFLTKRGIAVMGHIGLMPQYVNQIGGYRVQGKDTISLEKIIKDAKAIESAGAFAIVIEAVHAEVILEIKQKINIPLIGIGATNDCDGQVLVAHDLLGLSAQVPKFVKKYKNLRQEIEHAFADYAAEVKSKKFPNHQHTYK